MMEVQQDESRMTPAVDASVWPDVDPRPLGLEDPWRLRVAAARVFSIVKNRDVGRFERAVGFLEATHRLLPGLVASIKHMKITFGLKTLVIMRMLRVGRGMVETVLKTSQFFPSKLPQYQGQCSQREMFLMRKNHLDFKTLAQALAMNKDKLEYYVANQMEEQYGERYAQKVEDRLLHYLQELEAALPGDSYIDKILKEKSPVTEEEEEKLLMEVITCDAADVATTLKKLLRCDVASCRPGSTSPSTAMEMSPPSRPALRRRRRSSEPPETLPRFQPEVFLGGAEADGEEAARRTEEAPASPQFCSKHQRWVRSILQECSEEPLPPQAHASSSPLLFPSSSPDAPSSEDLTPSDIVPLPPGQPRPPSQTAAHLLAGVQAPEGDRRSGSAGSGIDASHTELPLSSRDTRASVRLSPVVRLLDIASVACKPCRVLLKRFPASGVKRVLGPEVLASPHRHTAERNTGPLATSKDPATHPAAAAATAPNAAVKMEPAPSSPAGCLALGAETSRGPRVHAKPSPPSQASQPDLPQPDLPQPDLPRDHLPQPDLPRRHLPQPDHLPQTDWPPNLPQPDHLPQPDLPRRHLPQPDHLPQTDWPPNLPQPDHLPQPDLPRRHLPQPDLPQPYVRVYRLSAQQCCRVTKPRSSVVPASRRDEEDEEEEDKDADSSFDVNTLYSGDSSSDSEDSFHGDPEYKPRFKKKRLPSQ